MFFDGIRRRNAAEEKLEALEKRMRALETAGIKPPADGGGGAAGKKLVFKLDDAKMQEGIANLMGYDPFGTKRSDDA